MFHVFTLIRDGAQLPEVAAEMMIRAERGDEVVVAGGEDGGEVGSIADCAAEGVGDDGSGDPIEQGGELVGDEGELAGWAPESTGEGQRQAQAPALPFGKA